MQNNQAPTLAYTTLAYTTLQGTLHRNEDGAKVVTLPDGTQSYSLNLVTKWRSAKPLVVNSGDNSIDILDTLCNKQDKAIALIMGKCIPPLVAIDADSAYTRDALLTVINSLPKEQQPLLLAISTLEEHGKDGLHAIYVDNGDNTSLYDELNITSTHKKLGLDLDIIRGDNLLFLAGKANSLKKLIYTQPLENNTTKSIPPLVRTMIKGLMPTILNSYNSLTKAPINNYSYEVMDNKTDVATLLDDFMDAPKKRAEIINSFLKLRVAKDMRELFNGNFEPKYYTGKPHPLLLGLSLALKEDIGVSKDLHRAVIIYINERLPHSKDLSALEAELIKPDTQDPYKYIEEWKSMSASIRNKRNQILNIYSVSVSSETKVKGVKYIVHNSHNNEITEFKDLSTLKNELVSDTGMPLNRVTKLQPKIDPVALIERPDKAFGLIPKDNSRPDFNIYKRTLVQEVFYNPEGYAEDRKYPYTILALLESQFGEDKTHKLLLPFLKHKLLTREPTALIFALMGPPYSFKTGFFEGILRPLFSNQRYLKTNGDILADKWNDYLINLDILAIDEFHHLLGTKLLKPVIQTLNKFGAEYHEGIRRMNTSVTKGEEVPQEVSAFIAMNKVVAPVTEIVGERRLVVGYADRTASQALGIDDERIKQSVKGELVDFAYYLAINVGDISYIDYNLNTNWKVVDNHYTRFMNEGISTVKKIALAIGGTQDAVNLTKLQELVSPRKLDSMIITLKRASKGSRYRLRLWESKNGEVHSDTPALLDSFEIANSGIADELRALLTNNEKVISGTSRTRTMDLIIYPEELELHNIIPQEYINDIVNLDIVNLDIVNLDIN